MMTMFTNLLTTAFPGLGSQPPTTTRAGDTATEFEATFAGVLDSERWSSPCTDPSKTIEQSEPVGDASDNGSVDASSDADADNDAASDAAAQASATDSNDDDALNGDESAEHPDQATLSMIQTAHQMASNPSASLSDSRPRFAASELRATGGPTDLGLMNTSVNDVRLGMFAVDAPDLWVSEGGFPDMLAVPVSEPRQGDRPSALAALIPVNIDVTAPRAKPSAAIADMAPKNLQQFTTDISTHIRVIKNQGGGEARINLHPAELGRMSLSVVTEGSETKVSFFVENQMARQAIETALPRLREMLEQAGLSLAESDVSERDAHQEFESDAGRGKDPLASDSSDGAALDLDESLDLSVTMDPNRLLDTFA